MPVQPYVPSSYRSDRVLLLADNSKYVQRVDETLLTQDGETIVAYWISPMLNRDDRGYSFSLSWIRLFYSADSSTTITVHASGDGGNNWVERMQEAGGAATTSLDATTGEIRAVVVGFNVTGYDLRFRIRFTTDVAVKIFGYKARLIRRGLLDASDYASS